MSQVLVRIAVMLPPWSTQLSKGLQCSYPIAGFVTMIVWVSHGKSGMCIN